jgi:hypothetical protein
VASDASTATGEQSVADIDPRKLNHGSSPWFGVLLEADALWFSKENFM